VAHLDVRAGPLTGLDETVDDIIWLVVQSAAADRRKCDRPGAVFVGHLQTRADHTAQLLFTPLSRGFMCNYCVQLFQDLGGAIAVNQWVLSHTSKMSADEKTDDFIGSI